jgi:hypothetical protein
MDNSTRFVVVSPLGQLTFFPQVTKDRTLPIHLWNIHPLDHCEEFEAWISRQMPSIVRVTPVQLSEDEQSIECIVRPFFPVAFFFNIFLLLKKKFSSSINSKILRAGWAKTTTDSQSCATLPFLEAELASQQKAQQKAQRKVLFFSKSLFHLFNEQGIGVWQSKPKPPTSFAQNLFNFWPFKSKTNTNTEK